MAREYGRDQRVADFLQRELAVIFQREMKDPRVGFLSINSVRVSRDLGYADVYITSLGAESEAEREELVGVLRGAAGWLRGLIARRTQMRTTPRLRFHWDALTERSRAMDTLIDRARADDAARAVDGDPDAGSDPDSGAGSDSRSNPGNNPGHDPGNDSVNESGKDEEH